MRLFVSKTFTISPLRNLGVRRYSNQRDKPISFLKASLFVSQVVVLLGGGTVFLVGVIFPVGSELSDITQNFIRKKLSSKEFSEDETK